MAAKSPGVWGTQDWLDSTNVGYGSIPVSTSIWASFHCPIYFHLCSYIFPKLILPYFAYTQFWGWEFCGTHGFEVWELDDVFQVFYWLLNRKWQLCSDVFITKILTFENGWIFENICPYFQRLARQGILESAVAGAALWTPGSFWAEPGHIVGSLLGGRPWPKWGSQRWCLMAEDAPDCFCQEATALHTTKLYQGICVDTQKLEIVARHRKKQRDVCFALPTPCFN